MSMDLAEAIADFVQRTTLDRVPSVAVQRAKTAIADVLGVALAGSRHTVGRTMVEYVRGASSSGPATIIGQAAGVAPEMAALANGVLAHALDFDDRGHASTHTLPVCLALGEGRQATGGDILEAYIVGREVRMRLSAQFDRGRFESGGPGWRGWHATGVLGSIGSTAAAAKLLQLDREATRAALGLAASLAGGLIANFGTMAKPLHAGNAARNGVLAASLARAGFTAERSVFSARRGFADALFQPGEFDPDAVASDLAGGFHLEEKGVRIKPYPSCSGSHPYIEATRLLRAAHGLAPDAIESIVCTPHDSLVRDYPRDSLECKFSAAFCVVATLIDGAVDLSNCSEAFLARPDVQSLLERTSYDRRASGDFVRVTTRSGEVCEQALPPVRDLVAPEDVRAKFLACAAPVVGEAAAGEVWALVGRLEDLDAVGTLTAQLRPGPHGDREP